MIITTKVLVDGQPATIISFYHEIPIIYHLEDFLNIETTSNRENLVNLKQRKNTSIKDKQTDEQKRLLNETFATKIKYIAGNLMNLLLQESQVC